MTTAAHTTGIGKKIQHFSGVVSGPPENQQKTQKRLGGAVLFERLGFAQKEQNKYIHVLRQAGFKPETWNLATTVAVGRLNALRNLPFPIELTRRRSISASVLAGIVIRKVRYDRTGAFRFVLFTGVFLDSGPSVENAFVLKNFERV